MAADRSGRLLVISGGSGSMTPVVEARLRRAFADYTIVDFDPAMKLTAMLQPRARVVVAGGDGTVGWATRVLLDTNHQLGILGLGTFNNFARALRMPDNLERAIKVVRDGVPTPVTVGRINGKAFLEVAAIGMFGQALRLGEAAKDMAFGKLTRELQAMAQAEPFEYRLSGDIVGQGVARSLVFANTPSTGARMPVAGDKTPVDPYLELQVQVGGSYRDLAKRLVRSALGGEPRELGMSFRFRKLRVDATPRARAFADALPAGRTPAVVEAQIGALQLVLPPRQARRPRRHARKS